MQSFKLSFLGPRCEPRPPTVPWGPARRGPYQVGRQAQAGAAAGVLGVGVGAHLQQQPHGVRLAPGHGVHQRGAPWNETCDSARAWGLWSRWRCLRTNARPLHKPGLELPGPRERRRPRQARPARDPGTVTGPPGVGGFAAIGWMKRTTKSSGSPAATPLVRAAT